MKIVLENKFSGRGRQFQTKTDVGPNLWTIKFSPLSAIYGNHLLWIKFHLNPYYPVYSHNIGN